jgi:hypothetical protein
VHSVIREEGHRGSQNGWTILPYFEDQSKVRRRRILKLEYSIHNDPVGIRGSNPLLLNSFEQRVILVERLPTSWHIVCWS